jgi:hypothetical protein
MANLSPRVIPPEPCIPSRRGYSDIPGNPGTYASRRPQANPRLGICVHVMYMRCVHSARRADRTIADRAIADQTDL